MLAGCLEAKSLLSPKIKCTSIHFRKLCRAKQEDVVPKTLSIIFIKGNRDKNARVFWQEICSQIDRLTLVEKHPSEDLTNNFLRS